jgi:hypothetical protein
MSGLIRRYTELKRLRTFKERYEYLRLAGIVGEATFGFERRLNQLLYTSSKWRRLRNEIIIRDNGCDLGVEGYDLKHKIIVHHMNPLTLKDVEEVSDDIFNPEYLICVSQRTHNAIHYGDASLLPQVPIERTPYDTCPWKGAV